MRPVTVLGVINVHNILTIWQPLDKDLMREVGPKGDGDDEEVQRLLDEVKITYSFTTTCTSHPEHAPQK